MKSIKLLSFVILCSACSTMLMHKEIFFPAQLNEIEKLIVRRKIEKIGKKMVLDMVETDDPNTLDESKHLPTSLKIRKNKTDPFSTFIINVTEEQEKKFGYIPEQISKKKNGVWHITLPTNYLGNYTRYWHKKDFKGEYIELYSLFMYNPALLEVIYNY